MAATAGLIEYGIVQPDTARRLVFYSGIFALQTAMISAMVFTRSRQGLTRPAKVMGVLLALMACNNLNRAVFYPAQRRLRRTTWRRVSGCR